MRFYSPVEQGDDNAHLSTGFSPLFPFLLVANNVSFTQEVKRNEFVSHDDARPIRSNIFEFPIISIQGEWILSMMVEFASEVNGT